MRVVALPTLVGDVVRAQVDLWNVREFLCVAAAAETAIPGLSRTDRLRIHFMLLRCLVTDSAVQRGVVRYRLLPGDLAMASTTLTGHHGGLRSVRIVARHAGRQRVVGYWLYLRETSWSAGVVLVTQNAEPALAGGAGFYVQRGFDVIRGRSVTYFAPHSTVIRGEALLCDRRMAQSALLVASVLLLVSYDGVDGRCAVMPDVAESVGNQEGPRRNHGNYGK